MTLFNPIPHATLDEDLVEAIELLLDTVQNYVEDGLDFDLAVFFDAGEKGLSLAAFNELIDKINQQIKTQNLSAVTVH